MTRDCTFVILYKQTKNKKGCECKMLKETISKDIVQAMKEKDVLKKGLLQLVKAAMENLEIKEKRELTKEEEISIVQREVKQTKESLAEAKKYGREDLAKQNEQKLEILMKYLPKQLSEAEVTEIALNAGIVKGMKMGDAMKLAMPVLKGKTENALISKVVKNLIAE